MFNLRLHVHFNGFNAPARYTLDMAENEALCVGCMALNRLVVTSSDKPCRRHPDSRTLKASVIASEGYTIGANIHYGKSYPEELFKALGAMEECLDAERAKALERAEAKAAAERASEPSEVRHLREKNNRLRAERNSAIRDHNSVVRANEAASREARFGAWERANPRPEKLDAHFDAFPSSDAWGNSRPREDD